MTPRPRLVAIARAFAILLMVATLGMVAFSVASLVAPGADRLPDRPSLAMVLAASSVFVAFPTVGALVAIRRPDNPIGWLFLVIGLFLTMGFFSTEYAWRALLTGMPGPDPALVIWFGDWGFNLAVGLAFTWLPLLFPSGRLPGRGWGAVLWAATLTMAVCIGASAIRPDALDGFDGWLQNPFAAPASWTSVLAGLENLFIPVIAVLGMLSIGSLVVRFRRARAVERQQLKWFLLSAGSFVAGLVAAATIQSEPLFVAALLAGAAIPASSGIAILRYRLWDIDRIISRGVGWALVTAILVTVFAVAVIGLQALLTGFTQGETLAVAASTLVAFALFQPLRRRVQSAVDRRFNRARYDGERITAAFGDRLREQVDPGGVVRELAAATRSALSPEAVVVWLHVPVRDDQ